tara:strand:- start:446 stop:1111 length:666 start_codon:yes stop_codon:yes gene_type:complete
MNNDSRLIYEAYTDEHLLEENWKGAILAGLLCALTQTACKSIPSQDVPQVTTAIDSLKHKGAIEAMQQDMDKIIRGRDDLLANEYDKSMARIVKSIFGPAPDFTELPGDEFTAWNNWADNVKPRIIAWGGTAQDGNALQKQLKSNNHNKFEPGGLAGAELWPGWSEWSVDWLSRHPELLPPPADQKEKDAKPGFDWKGFINDIIQGMKRHHSTVPPPSWVK